MLALAAVSTVIVVLIDMSETGGFQFGVFHPATVPPFDCG
jgi:hypothetical protein